jgi:predicted esterase
MSKKRVLCLHGYHGSGSLVLEQMAPLFDEFSSELELVALDAPSIAAGDFGWWHGTFALWNDPLRGWDRTTDWVTKLFAHEQFDGIFGFSQGAALAGMLVGMRTPDGEQTDEFPLSFDFVIMASGFISDDPVHVPLYSHAPSYDLPSLHFMGRSDDVVPIEDSRRLAANFVDPVIAEHPGEHEIPVGAEARGELARFLGNLD